VLFRSTVKDHAGDGLLVLFGAPVAQPDHAARAARLARQLLDQLRPRLREWAPELGLGVGVASGVVSTGAIGGAGRLEYVAVGPAINLAARLCQQAGDGEALIDQTSRQPLPAELGGLFTPRPALAIKGYDGEVPVHSLRSAA
jgi:class 3 adenylate cyclase